MSQSKYVGYIRAENGFFYKNEAGALVHIPLSKKRLDQLDQKLYPDSDILLVSSSPENIDFSSFETTANILYVRFEKQLFYVNKTKNTCKEIEISSRRLRKIDREVGLPKSVSEGENYVRALSRDELRYLSNITKKRFKLSETTNKELEAITNFSPSEQHPLTKDFDRHILFLEESWSETTEILKKYLKLLIKKLPKPLKWIFQGAFKQVLTLEEDLDTAVSDMDSEDDQLAKEIEETQEKVGKFLKDWDTKKTAFNIVTKALSDLWKKILREFRHISKYQDKANLIKTKEQADEEVPDINGLNAQQSIFFRVVKIILTGLSILLGITVSTLQTINLLTPSTELGVVSNVFFGIFTALLTLNYLATGIEAYLKWRKASQQDIALDALEEQKIQESTQDWQAKFAKSFWLFGVSLVATVLAFIFVANPLGFFIVATAALTVGGVGTHVLSKIYLTVEQEKEKRERKAQKQCDVLVMTESPEKVDLDTLEFNRGYVRYKDQLFYIDKKEKICQKISISEENLHRFDKKLHLVVFDYFSLPQSDWDWGDMKFIAKNNTMKVQKKLLESLVIMTVSPLNVDLKTLPFNRKACVLFNNQCFYVDKSTNTCFELNVTKENYEKLHKKIASARLITYKDSQRSLSSNELKKIAFIKEQDKLESKNQLSLFRIDKWPEKGLLSLPISSNNAYVRYKNQLFYVNKKKKKSEELAMTFSKLRDFDKKMGISNLSIGNTEILSTAKILSNEELKQIRLITAHTRSLVQRYDDALEKINLKLKQVLQDLLEKIQEVAFLKSRFFKPFKWIFQGIKKQFSDEVSAQIDQDMKVSGATEKVEALQEDLEKKFNKELFDKLKDLAELLWAPLKQLFYKLPKSILRVIDKINLISKNQKEIGHLDARVSLFFSFLKSVLILGGIVIAGAAFYFEFIVFLDSTLKVAQAIQFVAILTAAIVIPIALATAIKAGLKLANASSSETELSKEMQDKVLDWKSKLAKNAWLTFTTAISVTAMILLASNPVALCFVGIGILILQNIGKHYISKAFLTAQETKEKEERKLAKLEEQNCSNTSYQMLALTYKKEVLPSVENSNDTVISEIHENEHNVESNKDKATPLQIEVVDVVMTTPPIKEQVGSAIPENKSDPIISGNAPAPSKDDELLKEPQTDLLVSVTTSTIKCTRDDSFFQNADEGIIGSNCINVQNNHIAYGKTGLVS